MWCPKCKNEYVSGVTHCPDCDVDLVEALSDQEADVNQEELKEQLEAAKESVCSQLEQDEEIDQQEAEKDISTQIPVYIEKSAKYNDVKSTAFTFTIIGVLGVICIVLFDAGFFSLNIASYMKIMMNLVMGTLFVIFTIVGIRSFLQLKVLSLEVTKEEETTNEINTWFQEHYSSKDIDSSFSTDELSEEQLYFKRYEKMKQMISNQYSNLSEDYLDHMIELLYHELFES